MTSRRNYRSDNGYGTRSARQLEQRNGIPLSHLSSMSRRQNIFSSDDSRATRVKAVQEDRLGRDKRVTGFLGKPRGGVIEQADRSADVYAAVERRSYRDNGLLKMVRPDNLPLRGDSGRFRDGRGERPLRSAGYDDDSKWVRKGNYDGVSYDGVGSLRGANYLTKSSIGSAILPGFIFESYRRTILEFPRKGSFGLPLEDRRIADQVGPGTKIFMFDYNARELHGVFQAESYATIDVDAGLRGSEGTSLRVRVRVAKACTPLTEREFKDIIQDNYYSATKFTFGLSKEQVTKLLHTFPSADAGRNMHVSLTSSRRTLDSGLSQSSQDFQSVSDDITYRKEERLRRNAVDTRPFSSHSYHAHDAPRFSSKMPVQTNSTKGLDDYSEGHEVMDLPLTTSRLVTASNPYSSSGKQQSLRSLPGSRSGLSHMVGSSVGRTDLKLAAENWREEIDPKDLVYRKRRQLSSDPLDGLRRRDRSPSPHWKDVHSHSRVEATASEFYERSGKVGQKDEASYLSNRRRRHNDIDLNLPLDMGHGDPAHLHDMESKAVRRRVWEDEEEEGYSVSPSKGRPTFPGASSLHLSDHLLASDIVADYDESRLDSRHMANLNRKDLPLSRTLEKGRSMLSNFTNGKLGKHPRVLPGGKSHVKDKSTPVPVLWKKPLPLRDVHNKEPDSKSAKGSVFKIKANLQAPSGRGKPERVVTLVNTAHPRSRLGGAVNRDGFLPWGTVTGDEYGNGSSVSRGRKRKASVWSRIKLPVKGPRQKAAGLHGKGRVFSRLGPSGKASFESRDEVYYARNKKKTRSQTELEGTPELLEVTVRNSSDALGGEEYLNEEGDVPLEESDKELEKAADDIHGWTRKKVLLTAGNSGDESANPDHGDYANAKGGRRKIVRPSIGAKSQAEESGWRRNKDSSSSKTLVEHAANTSAQPPRLSEAMDTEMANVEEVDSPLGSQHNLDSQAEDDHPDFEEDNMSS